MRDVLSNTVLTRKTYDNVHRLVTEEDLINNAATTYVYDDFYRPISKTTKNSSNTILAQETYSYTEVYGSEPLQRILKTVAGETNAPNIVSAQYINNIGQVVQEGRLLGGTEYIDYYTYDYAGNKVEEQQAYAAAKNLPYSTKWEYDYAGRVTKTYNADGGYTTNLYNTLGQLTTATDYAGTATTYTYDALDRLLEEKGIIDQTSGTVYNSYKRYDYDPAGNITRTRISNNQPGQATTWAKTENAYDNRGRLEYISLYNGANIESVTKYSYNGVGNTLSMQVGMSSKIANDGQQTTYTYDRFGRILTQTDPLNQQETYTYKNSGLGPLNSKTDRNGNISLYTYDALGRVLSEQVTTPENVTETNSYTYYLTGAKKTESNPTVTTTYIYDAQGRLTQESESGGAGAIKTYTYDIANNRQTFNATRSSINIHNTAYTYDNQNRLKTVSDNGSLKATYNYNANGARSSLVYTNGTSEEYTYNLTNWLTNLTNKQGGTTVSSYDYTYNTDGNQHTKTDHNGRVTTYLYDGTGRLTSESENTGFSAIYQYDRFSNRTQMSVTGTETYTVAYSYDANNRLTQDVKTAGSVIATANYFYDPNGNQIARVSENRAPAGSGTPQVGLDSTGVELYEYNGRNRMVWSSMSEEETTYTYRADGLRNSKSSANGTVTHLWDGANIVADLDGGGAVVARYVRGVGLILSDDGTGQKFYLFDGHGDVVLLANGSGNVLKTYSFDAFGNERTPDPADTNPFRYCAEYFDNETGTIYLRARYYNPSTGRFFVEDPIRDGLNWYVYGGNNPLFYLDPFGLAMVAIRNWVETKANSTGATFSIGWNATTRTASVYMSGNGYSGYTSFTDGVAGVYIELMTGRMIVDDNLLWAAFWKVIDPPSRSLFDAALETIPIVNYGEAAIGRNLDGNTLSPDQRLEKLGQGIEASADSLMTGLMFGGTIQNVGSVTAGSGSFIKHNVYNNMRNKIGEKGANQFIDAMNKGIVGSQGQSGIKMLSGSGAKIGNATFQYEVKLYGELANYRLYGNLDKTTGQIVFSFFGKALH